ncbi:MAG: hypothetical protein ACI8T1_005253, partial [Verrucomicrobiales bacterium]
MKTPNEEMAPSKGPAPRPRDLAHKSYIAGGKQGERTPPPHLQRRDHSALSLRPRIALSPGETSYQLPNDLHTTSKTN